MMSQIWDLYEEGLLNLKTHKSSLYYGFIIYLKILRDQTTPSLGKKTALY